MGFPVKKYDRLQSLIARWGVSQEDVYYAIENGTLCTCVWLPLRFLERGVIKEQKFVYERHEHKEGFVGVRPQDFHRICSCGSLKLRIFRSVTQEGHVLRMADEPPQPSISVRLSDLVILQKDRAEFEAIYEIKPDNVLDFVAAPTTPEFSASRDYRHVVFNGKKYQLGDVQAQIIEQLHDATFTDNPWIHGKTLIHVAGSRAVRLRDLFKNKSKWNDLIVSDARGHYRLGINREEKKKAASLGAIVMGMIPYLQDFFEIADCLPSLCPI
ncbi:MAG: hypothetical protein SFX19_05485 [Alphaproteobacteria bacterium]|nr:hypothetical protein [Alphaproteobacteria bacterium]